MRVEFSWKSTSNIVTVYSALCSSKYKTSVQKPELKECRLTIFSIKKVNRKAILEHYLGERESGRNRQNANRRKTDSFLSRVYLCRFHQRSYRSKSNKGATLIIGCVSRAGASTRLFGVLCRNLERMDKTAHRTGRVYPRGWVHPNVAPRRAAPFRRQPVKQYGPAGSSACAANK